MSRIEANWVRSRRLRQLPRESPDDPVCGIHGTLVLPDPDHGPSGCAELGFVEAITLDVSGDLRAPVGGIGSGAGSVFWAVVPEAAINEDGDPLAAKDDVGPTAQACHRPYVDSIPETTPMQLRSKGKLRSGVALAIALHYRPGRGRGGRGRFGNDGASSLGARSIGAAF